MQLVVLISYVDLLVCETQHYSVKNELGLSDLLALFGGLILFGEPGKGSALYLFWYLCKVK